jgi:murein DD-endopeptidase MepM/ murein hydrolase activator NlpD
MPLKLLTISFLIFASLIYAGKVDELKKYNKRLGEFDQKLSSISGDIIKEREAISKINKELKNINWELRRDKKKYEREKRNLETLSKDSEDLLNKQQELKDRIAKISARLLSLSIMGSKDGSDSLNSVILDEVFAVLNRQNRNELSKMNSELTGRNSKITSLQEKIQKLSNSISDVEKKKRDVEKKKKQKLELFNKLEEKKATYKKRLKDISAKQKRIKAEIEKAQQNSKINAKTKKGLTVKDNSSSYKREAVRKYRGKKTISPLESYEVLTRFGTYIDPIYKFKIFSSSVVLKPTRANSNVRNIFNGKITLLKEDKTLGKFVMIEHYNGFQTMYAHLDKFAPSMKVGKKVKKGVVIGRVSNKLYFEVMENRFRIDPLEVIE